MGDNPDEKRVMLAFPYFGIARRWMKRGKWKCVHSGLALDFGLNERKLVVFLYVVSISS